MVSTIEFLSRIFHLADLMGMEGDLISYETATEIHYLKANAEGIIFNKKVYTDENGYRVPNINFKYDKEKDSIFFIGDSTTFGNGVLENNSFVGLLRDNFNNLNFINSSVPGYNVSHFDKKLKSLDKFNRIKKIFYIYTLNDISKETEIKTTNVEHQRIKRLRDIRITNFINTFFRDKSVFYMWFKGTLTDPSERYFKYEYNVYKNKKNLESIKNYIHKAKTYAEKKNIDFAIVILPYEFQTRDNNCSGEFMTPQLLLVDILTTMSVEFHDFTRDFCQYKNPKELFYKFDPQHLSLEGHSLVFSLLKNYI